MKKNSDVLKEVYSEHRGLFVMMIVLSFVALVLFVFSLINLHPATANVNTGYGDIGSFAGEGLTEMQSGGGYRAGKWTAMLTFPALALILGVMHIFVALKIYAKRGEGIAKGFVMISIALVVMAFVVLLRLLGEG